MIALRLVKRPDGSVPALPPRPLDANGLTIGRSPQCGFVLADPLRGVSRKHAWIAVQRGGDTALLRCISTTTPLAVNGQQLEPGSEQVVKPGDRLRIGAFELQLEGSDLTTIPLPVAHAPKAPAVVSPPLMPTGTATPLRPSRLDALWEVDTAPDPLSGESPLPALNLTPSIAPRVFDAALEPPPARAPAAMPAPAPVPLVAVPDVPSSISQLDMAPSPPAPSVDTWMRVLQGGAAPSSIASTEPGPEAAAGEHEALRVAFLRGAGLLDTASAGAFEIDAESMEHLGALLRAATEGTLALLNTRSVAKRSIHAEGTHIAAQGNNPLKFAPDATEAIALLLKLHSARGFLDPVAALKEAHADLQAHQLAMAAGMRAAVSDLISRLGPHALASLDDDFEAVFGREFVRAYEEQARPAAPPREDSR